MHTTGRYLEESIRRGGLDRRELVRLVGATAMAGAFGSFGPPGVASSNGSTFQALELNHLALRVSNVERSAEFYRQHLGMKVVLDRSFAKFLGCGPHFVALFEAVEPGLDHFCVTLPEYRQADAANRLRSVGLEPLTEEGRTYFHDPDGLKIQIESPESWPGAGPRPDRLPLG